MRSATAAPRVERQPAGADNPKVTAEELFVINRNTGFNRFRDKFRKQPPPVDAVTSSSRAAAKARS